MSSSVMLTLGTEMDEKLKSALSRSFPKFWALGNSDRSFAHLALPPLFSGCVRGREGGRRGLDSCLVCDVEIELRISPCLWGESSFEN